MGKLFTGKVGKLLTRLLGNYLTATLGKVLDIYRKRQHILHMKALGSCVTVNISLSISAPDIYVFPIR
jgi:hypothetical protein